MHCGWLLCAGHLMQSHLPCSIGLGSVVMNGFETLICPRRPAWSVLVHNTCLSPVCTWKQPHFSNWLSWTGRRKTWEGSLYKCVSAEGGCIYISLCKHCSKYIFHFFLHFLRTLNYMRAFFTSLNSGLSFALHLSRSFTVIIKWIEPSSALAYLIRANCHVEYGLIPINQGRNGHWKFYQHLR